MTGRDSGRITGEVEVVRWIGTDKRATVRRSGTGSRFSPRQRRPLPMAKSKRKRVPKTVLKLPDLEQSKSAVLNSLFTKLKIL
jgi:hypothetical protein